MILKRAFRSDGQPMAPPGKLTPLTILPRRLSPGKPPRHCEYFRDRLIQHQDERRCLPERAFGAAAFSDVQR